MSYHTLNCCFLHFGAALDQFDGHKRCIDRNRVPRSSSAVDAGISTSSAVDLPLCFDDGTPGRAWWWWMFAVYSFYGLHAIGMLYTALLPLRYGDVGYRIFETMTYRRRLMAVTTLWAVSACFMYVLNTVRSIVGFVRTTAVRKRS